MPRYTYHSHNNQYITQSIEVSQYYSTSYKIILALYILYHTTHMITIQFIFIPCHTHDT
jgi:hypothetical protein